MASEEDNIFLNPEEKALAIDPKLNKARTFAFRDFFCLLWQTRQKLCILRISIDSNVTKRNCSTKK